MARYFPHDAGASDTKEMFAFRAYAGLEGLGFFWLLVEALLRLPGYRVSPEALPSLVGRFGTTMEVAERLIGAAKKAAVLSEDDDGFLVCPLISARLRALDTLSDKRRDAVNNRYKNGDEAYKSGETGYKNAGSVYKTSRENKDKDLTTPFLKEGGTICLPEDLEKILGESLEVCALPADFLKAPELMKLWAEKRQRYPEMHDEVGALRQWGIKACIKEKMELVQMKNKAKQLTAHEPPKGLPQNKVFKAERKQLNPQQQKIARMATLKEVK